MMPRVTRAAVLAGAAVLLAATVARALSAPSGEVWQADIRVQSLDVTGGSRSGQHTARLVIVSDNDDDARAARAEILLPVGVGVLRMTSGCKASASAVTGLNARVTCELGNVEVRGLRDVSIVTTTIPGGGRARFAVFVTSDTPDPDPANNYAERAAP
jgi:hypothetical protein